MWTLRDENEIMKAKISSKISKQIVAQITGNWENGAYIIGEDKVWLYSSIKLYIWKGDRLIK